MQRLMIFIIENNHQNPLQVIHTCRLAESYFKTFKSNKKYSQTLLHETFSRVLI